MKYKKIREEELKNKVGAEWFKQFDTTEILGNIDFTVFPKQDSLFGRTPLLWAEAKTGNFDVATMFVQLILTIGKARTFDKTMPPAFLGAFDFQKMAFVPYINIQDIFYLNDFNWNVTSSNHGTKEFKLIKDRIESTLKQKTYVFNYEKDEKELSTFINNNVAKATTKSKIKIDKNNFIPIYLRWLEFVKPIIDVNWEELNKANIYDSDFYLADLFVDDKGTQSIDDDLTIRDNLFVVFENQGYKIKKENIKQMFDATINLKKKETYQHFWKLYKRPPIKEFQDYIIYRKDLLVPQDIRERKGAFFTPRQWVELSQKYLTNYLGENWQDEYYIWDCAAGTGNLLAGLNNKYNIYASTLDQADVNVMHERIEHGANLLENHVFQFDFLNDDFDKLPKSLREIIFSEEKREKLIIYINPPYAEATNAKTVSRSGQNKSGVSTNYKVKEFYNQKIGNASNELFALFMAIIYEKIPHSKLAIFSKLKFIQGTNFRKFKTLFLADFVDGFISPAKTFDNVTGKFPIGFTIWDLNSKKAVEEIKCDIYNKNADFIGQKVFRGNLPKSINKWIKTFDNDENRIGLMVSCAPDFQHNKQLAILSKQQKRYCFSINQSNLIYFVVYYAVRKSIPADWINDRDQFLWPNDNWLQDDVFKSDCFTYTLFDNQIESKYGTNHWIPFTETEVNAKERFESNFMANIINGKAQLKNTTDKLLFAKNCKNSLSIEFSEEARETFNSGLELWKYYHSKENVNVNASIYEIREYFQGRNDIGRMNSSSDDVIYMELISDLRDKLKTLAKKIEPKIYEYGFLQK
ncbi:hypothetical protein SAMN05444278_1166 [Psychroflexus salarius]|uniref:Uncharacterized protein n=1 Tax=Psychroflexus salarius TaxID=1155689 RepID=A0A1M4Y7D1_9FLAO|nr:hypothetical protein [Psychroflexus salarius]SHF01717.1 hypothetical protein SAMN05444278_1166 [Psychroflexus salarius]